ncbi:GNAT family N-acetyltransferase [Sciscionella marina]|uniref:GNAT family N-acetyltransferase n=1 Tax=Sciscionella marina TaxID=508770 RepID=UPI000366FD7F|nr:GNAT family N-acetyltransferase [Sciscionella marina]
MTVRLATSEELRALPELEAASDKLFAEIGWSPLPPPGDLEELRAADWVHVTGRPPVGFARVEEVDGHAHLEQLAVHPDHGRRGHGGALVEAAFAHAVEQGYTAMTLITYAEIPWNQPFYAKHGFTELTELTPGLEELREHERALGLDALGTRVVLRRMA